ncbi:hypothetical protein OIU34_18595 [Pararhizobium sp. BT-229]|uniref:hypothetical protein n=1 Tax=Pararhizobium sp. BT-229 TaxID=2986923 RepID=UPI0021F7C8B4|nr:hypothetical protein [Pararhizobium sp. BT-229]MCV9963889.1 hypothetical protein [Pararhizobium sp. BT-229]
MRVAINLLKSVFMVTWAVSYLVMLLASALALLALATLTIMFPLPIAIVIGADHQEAIGLLLLLATPGLLLTLFQNIHQNGLSKAE